MFKLLTGQNLNDTYNYVYTTMKQAKNSKQI
jgi:hypothetical protein